MGMTRLLLLGPFYTIQTNFMYFFAHDCIANKARFQHSIMFSNSKIHSPPLTICAEFAVAAAAEFALAPPLLVEDFLEVVEFFRDTAAALFLTKSANEKKINMKL